MTTKLKKKANDKLKSATTASGAEKSGVKIHTTTTKALNAKAMDMAADAIDLSSLGEGTTILSDDRIKLDSAAAYKHLELQAFKNERPLSSNWVAHLVKTMREGTFRMELITLASAVCDELGGQEVRINGQHTCWAAIEYGKFSHHVRKIRYRCKTAYDLRQLYASYDRAKARSSGHVSKSYLCDSPEYGQFAARTMSALSGGLAMHLWPRSQQPNHSIDERCFLLLSEHLNVGRKVAMFIQQHQGKDERWVFRVPVVGAMFSSYYKSAEASERFWNMVATGAGAATASDPALRLRNFLTRCCGKGVLQSDRIAAEDEAIYVACLLAWNAFRDGRTLSVLRPGQAEGRPRVK